MEKLDDMEKVEGYYKEIELALLDQAQHLMAQDGDYHSGNELIQLARRTRELRISYAKLTDKEPPMHVSEVGSNTQENLDYPFFGFDEEGNLLKIGIGDEGEYKHVARHAALKKLIPILRNFAQEKREFSTNELTTESGVTKYRIYVILGALRSAGSVEKIKRGRYRIVSPSQLEGDKLKNYFGILPAKYQDM